MLPVRLHTKFLVLVLGVLVLFLTVFSIILVRREADLLERKSDEKQHILAFTIYADLKESMLEGTPRSTLKLMENLRGTYGLVRLETLRRDGTPAFGLPGGRGSDPKLEETFERGAEISYHEDGHPPRHTILFPLKNELECVRCHSSRQSILGVLLISLSREDTVSEIKTSSRRLALALFALIVFTGGVLYVLVHKVVLRPLGILHKGAERIGMGELTHRIHLSTRDEMQDLAQSLNGMATHIQESYSGLELRIKERTSEVEDKARKLYEYSRDMATISRLSTKVFNSEQTLDEMLDRFIWSVSRGLRQPKSMLCLIDRKQARLEVKRDAGLGACLAIGDRPVAATDPFTALVRKGRYVFVDDIAADPLFSRYYLKNPECDTRSLHVLPIVSGSHEKKCWKEKNCIQQACPAYEEENEQCWLVSNTLCGNALVGSYGNKISYCMTCDVFPVFGVLIVGASESKAFSRRTGNVLRILTTEMGAALENHRLHHGNRQLVKELLEMHKVTMVALGDLSLDRALEAFTDSALKFSGLDACNFWLLSPDGRELLHTAGGCPGSRADSACPSELPLTHGLMARVFTESRVISEYDLPRNEDTELGRIAAEQGMPSVLGIPLRTERKTIGVLSIHKKGSIPFLESEVVAFMLLANHAAMAVNVCLLNEELRNQNRELASSMNLMGGILSSMTSGVMLVDWDGRVRMINEAGALILRVFRHELTNHLLMDALPEAGEFLKTEPGPYRETELRRSDGSSTSIGFSVAAYNGGDSTEEGTIIVFRDLTEIKALRTAMQSKERFAAMGQVVAGVAHEIRNPLFGISSVGQIFERELTNPGHQELAKALLSETARLNQLVENLLVYGRPITLSLARCDLAALWQEVIGMHREEFSRKNISIRGDFATGRAVAHLDPQQIRQVCLNLLRNAVDATPAGGTIIIRLLLEDTHVIFSITDTGAGIPAGTIGKIFDLFFTTKPKGTGMGLAICKKIVEDHGGEITVESRQWNWLEDKKGTTVTVKLPYRRAGTGIMNGGQT